MLKVYIWPSLWAPSVFNAKGVHLAYGLSSVHLSIASRVSGAKGVHLALDGILGSPVQRCKWGP